MAHSVIMPKQGLQMTEGTITKWLVVEGGTCTEGEPLFEMETDKLTITMDSPYSGTLLKIMHEEGDTVPITQPIAVIGEQGENIADLLGTEPAEAVQAAKSALIPLAETPQSTKPNLPVAQSGRVFITPRAKKTAEETNMDVRMVRGTGPDGLIIERDILDLSAVAKTTPLARKTAGLLGVDISTVAGSGAHGKVTRADVEATGHALSRASRRIIPFTGMRKVIAERMSASLRTAAQTSHRVKADMSETVRMREKLKDAGKKVSYNDIIVLAVCKAIADYPIINSELVSEGILLKDDINIGIAVSVENGLIVPVIKRAETMTLEQISETARILGEKARSGKLAPEDYKDGSFTISNLGMFGLDEFVAIINPPEVGILAVGKIEKVPLVENDQIVIKPAVVLTLSYDHRVVDGAPAAQFLMSIKSYLENPYSMM